MAQYSSASHDWQRHTGDIVSFSLIGCCLLNLLSCGKAQAADGTPPSKALPAQAAPAVITSQTQSTTAQPATQPPEKAPKIPGSSAAAQPDAPVPDSATPGSDAGAGSPQGPVLKGGVRTLVLTLNEVREAGVAIDKVKRLSADLYEEMTRHDVQLEEEPEIIGTTVVYIPVNFDAGTYLPPRKKWVDLYMSQLGPLVTAMKSEITDVEIAVPEETKARLRLLFNDWVSVVTDVQTNLAALQNLTCGSAYDTQAIVQQAATVHADMEKLEETRKKIYSVVKHMPKETGAT